MQKKRILPCFIILLILYCTVNAEQPFFTINEVREQSNTLCEAYGTAGTINVETMTGIYNVSIDIPTVDRVPVVKITFPSQYQIPASPRNGEIKMTMDNSTGDLYLCGWAVEVNRETLYGNYVKNAGRIGQYGMDAHADGSPLTMDECLLFAEQVLSYYKDQYGWEFELHNNWSNSRRYYGTFARKGFTPDLNHPVDDTGYYTLEYKQVFHGIPYYDYVQFAYPSKNDRHGALCLGSCQMDIYSPNCYSYYIYPSVEVAILEEDVPLCSMETVIKAFKESCKYTSDQPCRLRFVYMSMNDPDDRDGDHLILFPCWILECDYGPDWGGKGYIAIVSAQTGEFIDMYKNDKNSCRDAIWFGRDRVH